MASVFAVAFPACWDDDAGLLPQVWVERATRKLPSDVTFQPSAGASERAVLWAARGEWEPFQLVIRPKGDAAWQKVGVTVTDLVGPGKHTIPAAAFRLFLVHFIQVETGSPGGVTSNAREPETYPDPLIPFIDPYDPNRAPVGAPFNVEQGTSQSVFVEVFVPRDAPAGTYTGAVVVSSDARDPVSLPVSLTVWNFEIPAEPSIATSFHLGGRGIRDYHGGPEQDAAALSRIRKQYEEVLHRHRIDTLIPYHMEADDPLVANLDGSLAKPQWASFDAQMGPRLDGTFYADGVPQKLFNLGVFKPGAQSGLEVELTDDAYIEAAAEAARHLKKRGWFDRVYVYVFDEPYWNGGYERIVEDVALMKKGDPDWEGHFMAANHYVPVLDGSIDIWAVDTKNYDEWMWGAGGLPGRQFYGERRQAGDQLWLYNCLSTIPPWAGYDIDSWLGHEPRILKWGAFYEGATGFLYWSVNFWVADDPWGDAMATDAFGFAARNGDGILLYPGDHDGRLAPAGSAEAIVLDGPVESYRLKMVREGLEDWEYFLLGSALFGEETIRQMVAEAYTRLGAYPDIMTDTLEVFLSLQRIFLDVGATPPNVEYNRDDPPWALDDAVLYEIRGRLGQMISDAQSGI